MSNFPIEEENTQGIADALNYLLSGPSGLGQNFSGFSAYADTDNGVPYAYLTGNFRKPYTYNYPVPLYVADINLSNAQQLDSRTIKYTFSSAQASAPFLPGQGIYVSGVTPSTYNTSNLKAAGLSPYNIGVVECTTTYVTIRTGADITTPLGTYVSGGATSYSSTGSFTNSTDCNARCTVSGGTDKVFIGGQIDCEISYQVIDPDVAQLDYYVYINRYKGVINNDPVNPDYIFDFDGTVSAKKYTFDGLAASSTGTLPIKETVFTSIFDQPSPGYYWYILELQFNWPTVWVEATSAKLGLRSLSVQVVKQ